MDWHVCWLPGSQEQRAAKWPAADWRFQAQHSIQQVASKVIGQLAWLPQPRAALLLPCRTVLETTRTLLVWLGALLLFYSPLGAGLLGEPWTSISWIQAAG
jgi:hypothetical protein